jgi:PKD domain
MRSSAIHRIISGFLIVVGLLACGDNPTRPLDDPLAGPTTPQGPQASPPNIAPSASAGADQTVECASHAGSSVSLTSAGSSDSDGQIAAYEWFENGHLIATGPTPTITLARGAHTILLRVKDDDGGTNDDVVLVTVADTRPPTIALSISPTTLWPPNHTMHLVSRGVSASDVCDAAPALLVTVASDEAENGLGDGDTAPDWSVQQTSPHVFDVSVRAERSGREDGRVYTIRAVATDASGNGASSAGTVSVPHNQ